MRIFDRIASGETVFLQDGSSPTELQTTWRRAANTATRVVADDAAQFVYQSNCADWSVPKGHFGVMRPPFSHLWIEWQTPTFRFFDNRMTKVERTRIAVSAVDYGHELRMEIMGGVDRRPLGMWALAVSVINYDDLNTINAQIDVYPEMKFLRDDRFPDFSEHQYASGLYLELFPAFLALGWMNCRNAKLSDVKQSSRVTLRRARKGQPLGLDYKRIIIDNNTSNSLASNRRAETTGQRLHIVRGHMRTYTSERPAFGSYVGNMWIHQHMRGDADLGRINHEYHVTSRGAQ